ncbi:MAG: hypothetical protein R2828_30635 [Saprospiraceae bacterium]
MKDTKLIQLLQTLDGKQRRAFGDFVQSPFFNKQEELIHFYHYLKKIAAKGFPEKDLDRYYCYQLLFPEKAYDEKHLNYLNSQLLKLAERYISINGFENALILPAYFQLQYCIDHRLEKHYQYIMNQSQKQLEAYQGDTEQLLYQKYLLANLREKHFSSQKQRRYDKGLQEAADYFDQYYLFKKLYHLCAMLDRQKVVTPAYEIHFMEEIQSILRSQLLKSPPIETLEQLLLSLTAEQSAVHFSKLRDSLRQYSRYFSHDMLRDLYFSSINFCIRKIRFGEKEYAEELMSIYQEGIQNGVLFEDGYLSPWTFKNLVKLSIGLKEFEWAESFIADYSPKLPPHMQKDALHFNLANLYYERKDYPKAQTHLRQVEFSDVQYSIGAKLTLIRIYYETQQTEALNSLLSAFNIFLKRKKLMTKEVKMPFMNFIHFVYRLQKVEKGQLSKLESEIKQTEMLTARSWLLEQLRNLR